MLCSKNDAKLEISNPEVNANFFWGGVKNGNNHFFWRGRGFSPPHRNRQEPPQEPPQEPLSNIITRYSLTLTEETVFKRDNQRFLYKQARINKQYFKKNHTIRFGLLWLGQVRLVWLGYWLAQVWLGQVWLGLVKASGTNGACR